MHTRPVVLSVVLLIVLAFIVPSPLLKTEDARAEEVVTPQFDSEGPGPILSFTPDPSPAAAELSGLTGVGPIQGIKQITVGSSHTCAMTNAGGALCWGWNDYGQLGDGTTTTRSAPVDVSGLGANVAAISAGTAHTCALTTAGGVKCWGWNYYGQLGDGTKTDRLTPVDASGLGGNVTAISAGFSHTCALTTAGGVKCWGDNSYGQLGDGTTTAVPNVVCGTIGQVVVRLGHFTRRVGSWLQSYHSSVSGRC